MNGQREAVSAEHRQDSQHEAPLRNGICNLFDPVVPGLRAVQLDGEDHHGNHSENGNSEEDNRREGQHFLKNCAQMNPAPARDDAEDDQQESCRHQYAQLSVQQEDVLSGAGYKDFPQDFPTSCHGTQHSTDDKERIPKPTGDQQHADAEKQHRKRIKERQRKCEIVVVRFFSQT